MSNNTYGSMRIYTKAKTDIISLDPKDITVDKCCVYAYPRNKSYKETDAISRTLLGEYSNSVYAMEAVAQIFTAVMNEKSYFAMPGEEVLEPLLEERRKRNMNGIEDAVLEEENYKETDIDWPGVYGYVRLEDAGKTVEIEMSPSKREDTYNFSVYENNVATEFYEEVTTIKTFSVSRYNVYMAKMYRESEKRTAK